MLKIIPLIIIPLFFFIIFLGVENLTQISKLDVDLNKQKLELNKNIEENYDSKETNLIREDTKNKSEDIVSQNNEEKTEKKDTSPAKERKDEIAKKESEIKKNLKKHSKPKVNSTLENNSDTSLKRTFNVKTQFGAFSKKNYAYSSKDMIESKIKSEFPNFLIKVEYDEKNSLYRLVHFTEDETKANKLCKFSKSKKISCIIVKK